LGVLAEDLAISRYRVDAVNSICFKQFSQAAFGRLRSSSRVRTGTLIKQSVVRFCVAAFKASPSMPVRRSGYLR